MKPTLTARALGSLFALALVAAAAAAPLAAQAKKAEELRYPPLPAFTIPQPQRLVLGNGLTVLLLEDHELPLVRVTALVRAGSEIDPAAKVGLAELGADVLRSGGAGARKADELDDFLESKAARIEAGAASASVSVSLDCLAKDLGELLPAFADVLRRPLFAEDRLAIAKTRQYAGISRQNDNPQSIIFREMDEIVYGEGSPYARKPTYASVGAVTREDLVAWHERAFSPKNTLLGVVGDVSSAAVLAQLKEVFGDWREGAGARPKPVKPSLTPPAPRVVFIEKSDVTQSNISLGSLGIERRNPDYFAVEVMNQVLSGGFASRLFSNIRTKQGLAYGVFGEVGSEYDHLGRTLFWLSTKTETTGAAIDALYAEIRGMVERPPTDDEVAKAKATMLNSFIFNADTKGEVLRQQLQYELYGFPRDWLERYRAGIEKSTTAEVVAAAKKYLHPEALVLLVVGPAAGLDKPLSSYGKVENRDITIAEPPAQGGGR